MTLAPLPVTVVAGYLGAGKTTLINRLLRNPGGRRLMVMVNDFGALNIDADLLESADEDTLTLSNGCICCTMGTELLYALGDALDRRPRPDHLVIEASGVAQPAKIAAAAMAEPDMQYAGVVTLVDAAAFPGLAADEMVGAQLSDQVVAADLVIVTKADAAAAGETTALVGALTRAPMIVASHGEVDADLLLGQRDGIAAATEAPEETHGSLYASWSVEGGAISRVALDRKLASTPSGLFRLKGFVEIDDGTAVEAHIVGPTRSVKTLPKPRPTRLVAIGFKPDFDTEAAESWWRAD